MKYIDAHTHVQFEAYANDYKEVMHRAHDAGVIVVNVGTQKVTSMKAVELTREFPQNVYAVVGVHPLHSHASYHDRDEVKKSEHEVDGEKFDYEYYKKLAEDPKVIAIGECGLDFFRVTDRSLQEKQKEILSEQIKLAHEVKKPLMIHCRSAYSDLISILNSKSPLHNSPSGVIHFFAGTKDEAKQLLDLDFYFTFGGVITFARDYDEVIKMIPMDRILSETDAPYVTPIPYRGKRNEPANVIEVVKKLAEIKDIPIEQIRKQILQNAKKIFKI